ncbi:MAG TPA: nucleoside triphosphate pyrophosphohydrolase [Ruminococcaceae bacterium]|nr:nucleoside triphosphate pyrophosphohydrolase [Oscillospiraceae bacterium]
MNFHFKDRYDLSDLRQIVRILRSPEGCPWDQKQDHHSIRNNFIEETYEAVEALDTENSGLLCEELGDVLFQVVFHAALEEEAGRFTFDDVVDGVAKKMIVRHPHVFGTVKVQSMEDVLQNWDAIKAKTKHRKTGADVLENVSPALPALMRAAKVQKKAQAAGYPPEQHPKAIDPKQAGELLMQAVRTVRAAGLEPEQVLSNEVRSYIRHFAEWETCRDETAQNYAEEKRN